MHRQFLILGFLCLISRYTNAQEIVVEGKIVANSLNASKINIINISTGIGTTNTNSGEFSIKVSAQDTLLFSSVQFERKSIIISSEIIENRYLEVVLKPLINQLEEVDISKLSGNLSIDSKSIPIFDKYALKAPMSTKTPLSKEEKMLYTATTGPGGTKFHWYSILSLNVPVFPILNAISGRTAKLKKRVKISKEKQLLWDELNSRKQFFIETLNLSEDELALFQEFCNANPRYLELVKTNNKLELIAFYKKHSVQFLKLLEEYATNKVTDPINY
ncbi:hypothetical protein [Zunongwangia sp.]|uniref:hypothetical protein n=1 Tax=Zunongwangia sp. TaxID=1965325 RepID=UPI003AA7ED1B